MNNNKFKNLKGYQTPVMNGADFAITSFEVVSCADWTGFWAKIT